jgi:hypothetical protein
MSLEVNFARFLDEDGNVLALTDQASTVFRFITKIVSSASRKIEEPMICIDLQCNTRAVGLACTGYIEATSNTYGIIEWYCNTCEASGNISNWQGTLWDKQHHTIH